MMHLVVVVSKSDGPMLDEADRELNARRNCAARKDALSKRRVLP